MWRRFPSAQPLLSAHLERADSYLPLFYLPLFFAGQKSLNGFASVNSLIRRLR